MPGKTKGVKVSRHGSSLSLAFANGNTVKVSLSHTKMSSAQRNALNALLAGKAVPSEKLSQIRKLKATLGSRGKIAGLICNFDLKCVVV